MKKLVRKLSDMKDFYKSQKEVLKILEKRNPVIYEVYETRHSDKNGDLCYTTTIIYPGKIGKEYFMTKGHFHKNKNSAEVYFGLSGRGKSLLMDKKGNKKTVEIKKDKIVYIPPDFAHRTVNTGKQKLRFLSVYPSDAGHDYEAIRKNGF